MLFLQAKRGDPTIDCLSHHQSPLSRSAEILSGRGGQFHDADFE
jgi:hypothetical protein